MGIWVDLNSVVCSPHIFVHAVYGLYQALQSGFLPMLFFTDEKRGEGEGGEGKEGKGEEGRKVNE